MLECTLCPCVFAMNNPLELYVLGTLCPYGYCGCGYLRFALLKALLQQICLICLICCGLAIHVVLETELPRKAWIAMDCYHASPGAIAYVPYVAKLFNGGKDVTPCHTLLPSSLTTF